MAGGFVALIWCFLALCASWWIPTPESSLFPEIDFASKLVPKDNFIFNLDEKPKVFSSVIENSVSDFSTLSNAGTMEIKRRLAPTRFFVQFSNKVDESATRRDVVLKVEEDSWPFSKDTRRV
jgi:hypothetical protein